MFLCVYISVQCMTGQTKMAYHRYSAVVITLIFFRGGQVGKKHGCRFNIYFYSKIAF